VGQRRSAGNAGGLTLYRGGAARALRAKDRDALFGHYRHTLEELGKQSGALALIFGKAQNKCQDPAELRRGPVRYAARADLGRRGLRRTRICAGIWVAGSGSACRSSLCWTRRPSWPRPSGRRVGIRISCGVGPIRGNQVGTIQEIDWSQSEEIAQPIVDCRFK